ncbi:MAG: hypothetical protein KGK15_13355 [Burkholderiales bacterium]|nr:hypothetical protein [Burkholderiales bacterium]
MANKTLGTRQKLVFRDVQQKRMSPPRKPAPAPGTPASPWRAGTSGGAKRRLFLRLPADGNDDSSKD